MNQLSSQKLIACLTSCLLLLGGGWLDAQDVGKPLARDGFGNREQQICRAVFAAMQRSHLGPAPMPAELQRGAIDLFLEQLDGRKMYFLQADVDSFRVKSKDLAEQLHAGDLTLAYEIYDVYRRRVGEQAAVGRQYLEAPRNFAIDKTVDVNYADQPYCVTSAELTERWRTWTKFQLLTLRLPDEDAAGVVRRIDARYQRIAGEVDRWDHDDLLERFLTAVAQCFDPHSAYLSAKKVESFNS